MYAIYVTGCQYEIFWEDSFGFVIKIFGYSISKISLIHLLNLSFIFVYYIFAELRICISTSPKQLKFWHKFQNSDSKS